uniref:Uncharacterized protein LOC100177451 n=1 Tax=Phallusia mammillata TaxID=59560 RepID=A0A6F9DGQ2_9ASCI|nr:uncharacterized protein LOC100177451 [Phallusia mammillata]
MRRGAGKHHTTSVFLAKSATKAILFAHEISLWDLENEYVISKFTPDVPFSCCTVAMDGRLIIAGLRDAPRVVTLRLMSRDLNASQYGRVALGDAAESKMFGEKEEIDSESSEDEMSGVE